VDGPGQRGKKNNARWEEKRNQRGRKEGGERRYWHKEETLEENTFKNQK